jgi:hypothetical protein
MAAGGGAGVGLGCERPGEEHRTSASKERPSVHHCILFAQLQSPPHVSLELARALPNARFEWMPGGARFFTQHNERLNKALLSFLDWLGAASA